MDDPDLNITVSEVPPRRQSSGLAYFKRIQQRSESNISETSSFNLLIDESPPVSPKYTQATIDDWLQPQKEIYFKSDDNLPELNVFSVPATIDDGDNLSLGPPETDEEEELGSTLKPEPVSANNTAYNITQLDGDTTQEYCDEDIFDISHPNRHLRESDITTQLYCDIGLEVIERDVHYNKQKSSFSSLPNSNTYGDDSQVTQLCYDNEDLLHLLPLTSISKHEEPENKELDCDEENLTLPPTSPCDNSTDSEATQLYCDNEDLLRLLPPNTPKKEEDLDITQSYCDENLFSLPTSSINKPMNSQATHLYCNDEESSWLPSSSMRQLLSSQEAQLFHLDYVDEKESSLRPLSSTRQHEVEEVEADYIEEFTPSPLPSYNSSLLQQLDEDPIEDFSPSPSPKRIYNIEDDPIEPCYDLSIKSRKTNGLDVAHSKLNENSSPGLHQIVRPEIRELRTSRVKKPVTIDDYFVLSSQKISSGEPEIIGRESVAPSYYENNGKNTDKAKSIDTRRWPRNGLFKNISN